VNTFVGRCSVLDELEQRYELAFGFLPDVHEEILETLSMLLAHEDLEGEWQRRRQQLLSEKIDLNRWMIDYFEQQALNP
jgi:hypothetical protein